MSDMTLREKIAREIDPAVWNASIDPATSESGGIHWVASFRNITLEQADRILALIESEGYRKVADDQVVVPREPTQAMLVDGYLAHRDFGFHVPSLTEGFKDAWSAMLAAAPKVQP